MTVKKRKASQTRGSLFGVFLSNKGMIANVMRRYRIAQIDIEDLTQETILRALEAEKRTEIREPRRFLVGIAKNVARAELDRKCKSVIDLLDDFDPQTYVLDEPAVDQRVDALMRFEVFERAVTMLPAQCQKVFVLKHIYGASHKEISEKLDIAVSTVEKHVALGLRRCREIMLEKQAVPSGRAEDAEDTVLGIARVKR